jgi:Fe2+ transport system protein FeoA
MDLIPLAALRSGESGRIQQVLGLPAHVHRLQEMGLRDGTAVEMVQAGSPCIIRLAGHKLCFRADEATSVLVRVGLAT